MQETRTRIKIAVGLLIVLFILVYGYYQARNILHGPVLTVTSPIDGSTSKQALLIVYGITKNSSVLRINDREVSVDEQGNFSEKLLVSPGYTIIEVQAQDRFGRLVTEIRKVVYTGSPEETSTLPIDTDSEELLIESPDLESPTDAAASTTEPIDLENS